MLHNLGLDAAYTDAFLRQFASKADPHRVSYITFREKVFPAVSQLMAERNLKELKRAFDKFDTDGDGAIAADEVQELMKFLRVPQQATSQFMAQIDADGDGQVTFDEFAAVVRPKRF